MAEFFLSEFSHRHLLGLADTPSEREAIQRLYDFQGSLDDLRCAVRLYRPHRTARHINELAQHLERLIAIEERFLAEKEAANG